MSILYILRDRSPSPGKRPPRFTCSFKPGCSVRSQFVIVSDEVCHHDCSRRICYRLEIEQISCYCWESGTAFVTMANPDKGENFPSHLERLHISCLRNTSKTHLEQNSSSSNGHNGGILAVERIVHLDGALETILRVGARRSRPGLCCESWLSPSKD